MSVLARAKEKFQLSVEVSQMLPVVLGINTVLLVAIEQTQGIPSWLKGAATLFLAF
jgi:hypothetical protein